MTMNKDNFSKAKDRPAPSRQGYYYDRHGVKHAQEMNHTPPNGDT